MYILSFSSTFVILILYLMNHKEWSILHTLEEIQTLIGNNDLSIAEASLNALHEKSARWHYLYSLIALKKSWFDSALSHLEAAITLAPNEKLYVEAKTALMSRHHRYSDDYYHRPRRRHHDCCCCCDGCCEFDCCDLICLDTCCECMGGDLIECI